MNQDKVKLQVNQLGSWRNVLVFDETAEAEETAIKAAALLVKAAPGARCALLYPDGHREYLNPKYAPKAEPMLETHLAYMARWKGHRQTLVTPCCLRDVEVPAPEEPGISWDSLMECPHCSCMFMKVVFQDVARGFIPAAAGALMPGPLKEER